MNPLFETVVTQALSDNSENRVVGEIISAKAVSIRKEAERLGEEIKVVKLGTIGKVAEMLSELEASGKPVNAAVKAALEGLLV